MRCGFTILPTGALRSALPFPEAVYITNELEQYDLARKDIHSALALKFDFYGTVDPDKNNGSSLSFFLNLPDNESSSLQQLLLADLEGIYLRKEGKTFRASPAMQLSILWLQITLK